MKKVSKQLMAFYIAQIALALVIIVLFETDVLPVKSSPSVRHSWDCDCLSSNPFTTISSAVQNAQCGSGG